MADILQRYGIKEVADVTFYHINKDSGYPDYPVLVLDSLKVTSIEQTAETAEARGGKGNGKLIVWDFGKEITVNIEDALFSPKSLAVMFGDGNVYGETAASGTTEYGTILKSARVVVQSNNTFPDVKIDGKVVNGGTVTSTATSTTAEVSTSFGTEGFTNNNINFYKNGSTTALTTPDGLKEGDVLYAVWNHLVKSKSIIRITPDSFPGTYYVTGDTMVRNERNGEDEYFQFVIPKAKMTAEQTIEMSADGDPTTFNFNLQVLRPESGDMVKFIKYEFADYGDNDDDGVVGTMDFVPTYDGFAPISTVTEAVYDPKGIGYATGSEVGGITKVTTAPTTVTTVAPKGRS